MDIGISGIGMMGGSIAEDLHWGNKIHGFIYNEDINKLVKSNLFETISYNEAINSKLEELDVLFLCGPLEVIKKQMIEISFSPTLTNNIIITDISSTKEDVMVLAHILFKDREDIMFIGGHPMAGSEKSGFINRQKELFEDEEWFLTYPDDDDGTDFILEDLLHKQLQAELRRVDFRDHDKTVAFTSHLPQLLSSLLNYQFIELNGEKHFSHEYVGKGFRDMTRLSNSNYEIWGDIFKSNKLYLDKSIDELIIMLKSIKENDGTLKEIFDKNRRFRGVI